jgi:transposase
MENLKNHLKVDRIIRISDKGCFSAKIVAETVKQGFDLIASMKLNEQYIKLLEEAMLRGQDFTLLDYLSQNQARKKVPSEQDRYYGMDVENILTYGIKKYPMRFIFVRSDGKIKRDRNRREKQIKKIEAEINILKEKVGMPYYRDAKKLQAKIDLLCKRYPEGRHLQVELLTSDGKAISLSYKWDKGAIEKEARLDGIYLLGTTLMEHPMGTVFRLFKEQHYSESANKDLKGPLRIRPVFLQNQGRIESLIFILFLSLMVYMFLERWYRNSVPEPSLRKTTTRTLLSFFRNYALTVMVRKDGILEIPNSLNVIQNTIFSVLGLEFSEIYHKFTYH